MWTVYILKSQKTGRKYIGITKNLDRRLEEHNSGKTSSIRYQVPFTIIHTEEYTSRKEAFKREKERKAYKGGEALNKVLAD